MNGTLDATAEVRNLIEGMLAAEPQATWRPRVDLVAHLAYTNPGHHGCEREVAIGLTAFFEDGAWRLRWSPKMGIPGDLANDPAPALALVDWLFAEACCE